MARLPNAFNAAESDKLGSFKAIPAGDYIAQIIKSELKSTKNNDGKYLSLTFQIIDGEHNGRQLFARLNLVNNNVQTVEIAQKTLATIAECCGVDIVEDSEQLHGVPMVITVIVKPQDAQYPETNDIRGYARYEGAVTAAPVAAKPPIGAAKPGAAAPGKTPPWKRA